MRKFILLLLAALFLSCEYLPYGDVTPVSVSSSVPEVTLSVIERSTVSYVVITNVSSEIVLAYEYLRNGQSVYVITNVLPNEQQIIEMIKRFNGASVNIELTGISIYN